MRVVKIVYVGIVCIVEFGAFTEAYELGHLCDVQRELCRVEVPGQSDVPDRHGRVTLYTNNTVLVTNSTSTSISTFRFVG